MRKNSWSSNGGTKVFLKGLLLFSIVCSSIFTPFVNFDETFFSNDKLTTPFFFPKTSAVNVELISESDKTTRWEFENVSTTNIISGFENSSDNWDLYNVSQRYFIGNDDYLLLNSSFYGLDEDTGNITADGDVLIEWQYPASLPHWNRTNEETPDGTFISVYATDENDYDDRFTFNTLDLSEYDSPNITKIKVWIYHKYNGSINHALSGKIVNPVSLSTKYFPKRTSWTWDSVEWSSLTWDTDDLDDLEINFNLLGYSPINKYVDTIYCEITFAKDVLYNISKKYQGNGIAYIQTNTTEILSLRSPNTLNLSLMEGDRIKVKFNTTSTNRIDLNLLNNSIEQESFILSEEGNDDFTTMTKIFSITSDISVDQFEFTGTFSDTKNLIIDNISVYTPIIYYVEPYGRRELDLNFGDNYIVRVYEKDLLRQSWSITTSSELRTLIYENVIPSSNIEIISESEYKTRWDFINVSSGVAPDYSYNEDFPNGSDVWSLYDVSNPTLIGNVENEYEGSVIDVGAVSYTGFYASFGSQDSYIEDMHYANGFWWVLGENSEKVYKYYDNFTYTGLNISLPTAPSGSSYVDIHYRTDTGYWYVLMNANRRIYEFYSNWSYITYTSLGIGQGTPTSFTFHDNHWWIPTDLGNVNYLFKFNASYVLVDTKFFLYDWIINGIDYYQGYFWLLILDTGDESLRRYNDDFSVLLESNNLGDLGANTIYFKDDYAWITDYNTNRGYKMYLELEKNKIGQGNSILYGQTDIEETLTLRSQTGLGLNLEIGDRIKIRFNTTSTNRIDFNLLNNDTKTFVLSSEGNTIFTTQTITFILDENMLVDQLEFTSIFEEETKLVVDSIQIYKLSPIGLDTYFLEPFGRKVFFLPAIWNYTVEVYEENRLVEIFSFLTSLISLTVLIYEVIKSFEVYITYYDANNEYLNFYRFITYVNYTLDDQNFVNERLSENILSVDDDSYIYFMIYDSFDVLIKSITLPEQTFADIILDVFTLKIKNKAIKNVDYTLSNQDSEIDKSGILFPEEIDIYSIAIGNYSLNYTNFEDEILRTYTFNFTANFLITINTTTFDVYFGIFNFDGLGLSNEIVRFFINSERKDFGFNTLTQDTNRLTVKDYFNELLVDQLVDLRDYTEYNILVEVYTLILNNNYTHSIYIEIERNDIELKQIIPSQSSISLRFLPDIKYTITYSYINGTEIGEIEVKLDKNNKIVSFGFYEVEVPISPLPILNSIQLLIWFGFFIMGIAIVVIVLYYRIKGKNPQVSTELRNILLQRSRKKKKAKRRNPYDNRDIYMDT